MAKLFAAGSCQYDELCKWGFVKGSCKISVYSELGSQMSSVIHSPTVEKFIKAFTRILRARKLYLSVSV